MILRINIGAFVLTDAVRTAVQELGDDRLFLRSNLNVTEGGMGAALDFLSQRSTPELLIIETTAQGDALFDELNALADVCQPGTRVILVGAENDINLFKTLIDQGISQYFLETVSGEELKASVVEAFSEKAMNAKSRTIAFYGMRGGVGSSELAHNVASELAELYNEDVILVDLDIAFGTAALSYNLQPAQTVADAIAQAGSMDEMLMMRYLESGAKNVSLLCAPGNLNSGIDITPQALEMVLKVIKEMASYVVLDIPHMWNPWVQDMLVDADDTIIVGTPDLYNLRDGKNLFEFLAPNRGMEAPTRLILNKVGELKKGALSEKEFADVLGTKPSLSIPFDGDSFSAAMNNGELLRAVAPKAECTATVQTLTQLVSGKENKSDLAKKAKGGLLASLFKK